MRSRRFGSPNHKKTKYLLNGVVSGIGGYGNCIGVPTVGGETEFDVSFCPERTAEGKAIEELATLPQIVSGRTSQAVDRAKKLFGKLTQNLVVVTPEEAELAKLFTNSWRYIKFAAANQFFVIANDFGVDFITRSNVSLVFLKLLTFAPDFQRA